MRKQGFGWLYIALAVPGVVGLLLLIGAATITVNSNLCGTTCHQINPAYQSWTRSDHANVPCRSCHVGRSPITWFRRLTTELPRRVSDTIWPSTDAPINRHNQAAPTITNDRCLGCHSDVLRNQATSRNRRYRQRHREHTEAGVRCTECHNRVAHASAANHKPLVNTRSAFRYRDFMQMRAGCWRCHSTSDKTRDDGLLDELGLSDFPPTECHTCHRGRRKPAAGRLNHTGVLGGRWVDSRHGTEALRDFDACLPCHPRRKTRSGQLSDCTGCHNGITMPHNMGAHENSYSAGSPKWVRQHAAFSNSKESCKPCHATEKSGSFCSRCHHEAFIESQSDSSTTWPALHAGATGDSRDGCQKCHMVEFCAYCHTNGEKPPPDMYLYRLQGR